MAKQKRKQNKCEQSSVSDCIKCAYFGGRRKKQVICLNDECIYADRRERRTNGSKN